MQTRRLGGSGLAVSEVSLGTLTWGRDTAEPEASELYSRFVELGGTTLDVPSSFSSMVAQNRGETVSSVIKSGGLIDPVLVLHSTEPKQSGTGMERSPSAAPSSRRNLLQELDYDLKALGRDHVDLWVVHGPRLGVSYEEIAQTIVTAVESGRVRYVGLAQMGPWDFGSLVSTLRNSCAPVRSIAAPFSLLASHARQEILGHCVDQSLGFLALSALAGGVLTGKYRRSTPTDSRAASKHLSFLTTKHFGAEASRVVEAVVRVADGLGVSPGTVAAAWVLSQPAVSSAVVGPRTLPQLEVLLDGLDTRLPRELREALADVSIP